MRMSPKRLLKLKKLTKREKTPIPLRTLMAKKRLRLMLTLRPERYGLISLKK